MNRKIICIMMFFILAFFIDFYYISADNLHINDKYYAINDDESIKIIANNILIKEIKLSKLLDMNDNYILYNQNNDIYLYDYLKLQNTFIVNNAYNALLADKSVIYESDIDNNYVCKDILDSIKYRNCFKIYKFDIEMETRTMLKLPGDDNYLNDYENNILVFTSIHKNDQICKSICSFINIYDLGYNTIKTINQYYDIFLDMSGNATISDNIIYFESVPNVYQCMYNQIFSFDLFNEDITMITNKNESCFNENSEILTSNNGYLLFKTKFNNYENNNYINYIYSKKENKYKSINDRCKYNENININLNDIYCLNGSDIIIEPIDNTPPTINMNKIYTALKENKDSLSKQLEYSDDLTNNHNIKVEILDSLIDVGTNQINIKLCDSFSNCLESEILVEVIDKDETPPKIYCTDTITIKNNESFEINDYGYAIDNVDGKLKLEVAQQIDYNKEGSRKILIKSEDSSGNISYMEIDLVIYSNFNLKLIYYLMIIVCVTLIIIIYILRFKKHNSI